MIGNVIMTLHISIFLCATQIGMCIHLQNHFNASSLLHMSYRAEKMGRNLKISKISTLIIESRHYM